MASRGDGGLWPFVVLPLGLWRAGEPPKSSEIGDFLVGNPKFSFRCSENFTGVKFLCYFY